MPNLSRRQAPGGVHGTLRNAAPYVLAVALQAACAAWPCAALAQLAPGAASSGSSETTSGQGDTLSSSVSRQKSDEQRMLGGPRTSGNPYSVSPYTSNGASPSDAEDALTNEKHMHVVTPGDYAASEASASGGRDGGQAAASGDRGTSSRSRIAANGMSRAGNAVSKTGGGARGHSAFSGYDYGAKETSPTAQLYGNPYASPYGSSGQSNAQLYKSPW